MVRLFSLWKRTSKDGKPYLSGKLGDLNVMIFPNKNKKADNQPDYQVMLAEPQNKGYGKQAQGGYQKRQAPQSDFMGPPADEPNDPGPTDEFI